MKNLYTLSILFFLLVSCSKDEDYIEYRFNDEIEQPDDIYQPRELKLKRSYIEWHNQVYIESEQTDYFYNSDGLLSKIEYLMVLNDAERRNTQYFYYTGNLIDSVVAEHHSIFTSGPSQGVENQSRIVSYYTHDSNGYITDMENWASGHKLSHRRFFYNVEGKNIKRSTYETPHFPNEPHTTENVLTYDGDNLVSMISTLFSNTYIYSYTYDNNNVDKKNVYSPSMNKIYCLSKNNVLLYNDDNPNGSENIYTYNMDLYPLTRSTKEGGVIVKTEKMDYY